MGRKEKRRRKRGGIGMGGGNVLKEEVKKERLRGEFSKAEQRKTHWSWRRILLF